ncbi:hypothetical protein O4H49_06035 [Kiloniella laminariae]|uniref:HEAT repeat domain-containing protein n=1 Tax=Kiloniella laminariae TaxID=454162 RepID=A0ABT4LGU2_9PROT|nr:hypothetical protein [Kiloniella laminariae]MCZ4280327.1 hypothetical protein [Kiloniella laminariae]
MQQLKELLAVGDRKGIGRAGEVASLIRDDPNLLGDLLDNLSAGGPVVRSHAAHALMQIGLERPDLLQPYTRRLCSEISGLDQWEIQEQLMKIFPLLHWTAGEKKTVLQLVRDNLIHKSAIVRACALQALYDFALADADLLPEAKRLLQEAEGSGAKSSQARARKLLAKL